MEKPVLLHVKIYIPRGKLSFVLKGILVCYLGIFVLHFFLFWQKKKKKQLYNLLTIVFKANLFKQHFPELGKQSLQNGWVCKDLLHVLLSFQCCFYYFLLKNPNSSKGSPQFLTRYGYEKTEFYKIHYSFYKVVKILYNL